MRKLLLIGLCITQTLFAQKTILHCGQLIDVRQLKMLPEMSVVIEGNKITAVDKGYTAGGPADKVINLTHETVLPGLIDCHTHLEDQLAPNAQMKQFTQNPADIAFNASVYARTTLLAGFTTVRDLGGTGVNISLRNAINKGVIIGPRIFTAGRMISSTGGHGDHTSGLRDDIMHNPEFNSGIANGVDECRAAVRLRYKEGSDLIKITATGGVLSMEKDGAGAQYTEEEIRVIVQTAKDYGMKVASHCHGVEGMKRSIRAGVTSIEHGTYMDAETMELMKQYGTYLVPTIIAGKSVADSATNKPGFFPPVIARKAMEVGPIIQNTFAKAYKAGVKIAFGTDGGVYAHGKNWMEFVYMSEAGMPVLECIRAATLNAADLIGNDQIGVIEKDKLADIVAIDGDPVKDVHAMGNMKFVMKNGVVYKNE